VEWLSKALCKGKHAQFWHPPADVPNTSAFFDVARQLCERCPVWDSCLDYGREETFGMWGGLTPMERKVFVGGRGLIRPHGTVARYRQGCSCTECENAAFTQRSQPNLSTIPNNGETLEDIEDIRDLVYRGLSEEVVERASLVRLVTD
jgi:WhiB family transcriptional regulator, redox-sensing transcriptional regulator